MIYGNIVMTFVCLVQVQVRNILLSNSYLNSEDIITFTIFTIIHIEDRILWIVEII